MKSFVSEIYEVILGISHKKVFVANKKTLAVANLHVANLHHEKFAQIIFNRYKVRTGAIMTTAECPELGSCPLLK